MGEAFARLIAGSRRHYSWLLVLMLVIVTGMVVLADRLLQPEAFPVSRVSFEGAFDHVDPVELERAVADAAAGNFFALDLRRIEAAAKSVPWVHRVAVRREWPQSVHIQITEHQLVARWGQHAWLNSVGDMVDLEVVNSATMVSLDGPRGTHKEVFRKYGELADVMGTSGLSITALTLTARDSWVVRVRPKADANAELTLMVGRHAVGERLQRFVAAYRELSQRDDAVMRNADLRYPNGFAVVWHAQDSVPPSEQVQGVN